ncbi:MAG: hypothetical protein ACI9XJ_002538 [Marivirga sp.]
MRLTHNKFLELLLLFKGAQKCLGIPLNKINT